MIGTRYVENKGLWVPEYTVGSGIGTKLANLAYRMGFKQKPGCGCPKKQAILDRWTSAGVEPPMYRGNALPILAGGTAGEEARCTELGADCLCSEQFLMSGFTTPSSDHYHPNDSTKSCSGESNNTGVIQRVTGGSAPQVGTDSTTLAALPAGSTVDKYLLPGTDHTGIFEFNHRMGSAPLARVAVRWYVYLSTDYEFANKSDPTACQNSMKWFSFFHGSANSTQWDTVGGANTENLIYAWVNWAPELDCCNFGPGYADLASMPTQARSIIVGHWYRYEVVMRNQTGAAGAILQAYRKDVTANTSEDILIDTSVACVGCGTTQDWTVASGATTTLTPPSGNALSQIDINFWRNAGTGGHCYGNRAFSHMLVASWSTDAGQRIGAASEIEGGGGGIVSPRGRIYSISRRPRVEARV